MVPSPTHRPGWSRTFSSIAEHLQSTYMLRRTSVQKGMVKRCYGNPVLLVSFYPPVCQPPSRQRDGIDLTSDLVAEVYANMRGWSSTQTADSQTATASLDVQSSTWQSVLTRSVMDEIPTRHSLFADVQVLPDAPLNRPGVRGSMGMRQTKHSDSRIELHRFRLPAGWNGN